jgi:hypothetical protein
MNMLRPWPGIRRAFLHATLLACASLAGYEVGRAAPAEVPAEAVVFRPLPVPATP